ncbi:hypothetical protein JY97_14935 [Alkalispirochaeta odontotermitis]|nr:hypothetical protein JY97_14935 [Alkalispirochaeta odontotermitis]CAB1075981.1 hypothetical protein D1AOALGA4SA_3783 [Olavius algarvensis Delta 1 endosymbiont]
MKKKRQFIRLGLETGLQRIDAPLDHITQESDFYFLSYPLMIALNSTTSFLLRKIGIEGGSEHETVHSEDEIKSLTVINRQLKLDLVSIAAETLSGLLMEKADRVADVGDRFELEGAEVEVLEMKSSRASRIRLTLKPGADPGV